MENKQTRVKDIKISQEPQIYFGQKGDLSVSAWAGWSAQVLGGD